MYDTAMQNLIRDFKSVGPAAGVLPEIYIMVPVPLWLDGIYGTF